MKERSVLSMFKSKLYTEDLISVNQSNIPWENLHNKKVLITGGAGLICSVLVDALIYRNEYLNDNIEVIVLGRNKNTILERFKDYLDKKYFKYIIQDVTKPIVVDGGLDFIIHGASKGDPRTFAEDPVGVMNANYIGTFNVLELAKEKQVEKVLFISSGEVYGIQDKEFNSIEGMKEFDYGYLDTLKSRSCYASSKRAAETLCASYHQQYKINFNIARPCHTFGAFMLDNDSRVIGEFINKAVNSEDIIMKSQGAQCRSYCYVADTVTGLLYILLLGKENEAYNIANRKSIITIKDLAIKLSKLSNIQVIYENPNELELKGFSDIQHAVLDSTKLEELGWKPRYRVEDGLERVINIKKGM